MEDLEKYIGTHVKVPSNSYIIILTKIRGRKRYHSINHVGNQNKIPILDTIIYELEFPDFFVEE